MKALEKYGRDWVKIQKVLKSRSLSQVRSHAQKTFLQMSAIDVEALIAPENRSSSQEEIIRIRKKAKRQNQNQSIDKANVYNKKRSSDDRKIEKNESDERQIGRSQGQS